MLPEPVETDSSTRPLTESVRSKVASAPSAGSAASANAVAATRRCFIAFLVSIAVVSNQWECCWFVFFPRPCEPKDEHGAGDFDGCKEDVEGMGLTNKKR